MPFINLDLENPRVQRTLAGLRYTDYGLAVLWRWVAGLAFALVLATGLALTADWAGSVWPGQRVLIWLHALGGWLLALHLLGHALWWLRRVVRHPRSLLAGTASGTRVLWGLLGLATLLLALSGFARFATFRYGWELPFGLTALHVRVAHALLVPWLFAVLLLLGLRYLVPVLRFLRQERARR